MNIVTNRKHCRIDAANHFIKLIGSTGRRFFFHRHPDADECFARFEMKKSGHLFFLNEWSLKWIYVSQPGAWRGFHHGGTLHGIVSALVKWIKTGEATIYPSCITAKHWGYPESDIAEIVTYGQRIGFIRESSD